MNKEINSTAVGIVVGLFVLLLIAILPISIEVKSRTADAQQPIPVTQLPVSQPVKTSGASVEYTLKGVTGQTPPMAFFGVGGAIDGLANPTLEAKTGDTVTIHFINSDPVMHDLTIDVLNVSTGQIMGVDETGVLTFEATEPGEFVYRCTVPGHDTVGMKGIINITGEPIAAADGYTTTATTQVVAAVPTAAPAAADAVSIIRSPADVPPPVGDREPTTIQVALTTKEVTGALADGTTYSYFTFDGQIPGPMLRVRVGDTVEMTIRNADDSLFPHSIDLHAVTGPGGGAVYTQTNPGGETMFTFQAINPGLFVYHCATPSVAHHIASGMYGLILVEPEGGLPPVDKEFYVMQGEIYTAQPFGTKGNLDFSMENMLDENAEYFVLNGASMALTSDENALHANVGETVRIFFGVGGPNATSSFHVIGEIFDRVYDQASLTANPLTDVQTTTVPPGGATMVEFEVEVPGRYILVDHALSRLERGLAGFLYVEGADNPTVFHGDQLTAGSGH